MSLVGSLRIIFRLAIAAALLVVAEIGHNLMPGSVAGGEPVADLPLVDLPTLSATPRLQNFARTPLCFEANQGQTDAQVQYLARCPGYTVFLTATEAVLTTSPVGRAAHLPRTGEAGPRPGTNASRLATPQSQPAVVRMQLIDSNPTAHARGTDQLPGFANYFRGNDPSQWRTHIPTYARVQYPEVYPGIGLAYYGNPQRLEYDFMVEPGADPSQIRLRFAGATSVSVDARGDLVVQAGEQVLLQGNPVVYQEVGGERRPVAASFVVKGQEVSFALGSYDRAQPVVIDPVLSFSTYLGGSVGDSGNGIAVDAAGNIYVIGLTRSPDFPTVNALQPTFASPNAQITFVAKLTADGSTLAYSTYLGGSGSGNDTGNGIAVDAAGNAYVTGLTSSRDFPTINALQSARGAANGNAFVAKLSADGSALVYSTYLGGSRRDTGKSIAVDAAGNAYIIGSTKSPDFPTANALQPAYKGAGAFNAYVAKMSADGSALVYSTYLGGSNGDLGKGIAVDGAGNAYVTGSTASPDFPLANPLQPALGGPNGNAFVAKLTADGSALVYSTYLGGSGDNFGDPDGGLAIAVDARGSAYVTGYTASVDFSTVNPLQAALGGNPPLSNAFVAKLTADGSALAYSTYLGGSVFDQANGIAVDGAGNAYVTGGTASPDFPTANPLQPALGGPDGNAFVAELSADGSALIYSTYLGGSGGDGASGIAIDPAGNAYITGGTSSPDFPTANALQPTLKGSNNAFVAKIGTVVTPGPAVQFQISVPDQITSGTPFDITITALDASGRTAVGYQGSVAFSTTDTDPGVVLPPDYTFTTADQGMHTFSGGCTLVTVGNQTLTATDTTDSTITGTATVTVNPRP